MPCVCWSVNDRSTPGSQVRHRKQGSPGEGLLYYGGTIVPVMDRFPRDTQLYRLMTTRLSETGRESANI